MATLSITITDSKVLDRLKQLQGSGETLVLPGLMEDIGGYLTTYAANEGMASQGGVFDANWPRLSQKYALYKAKKWSGRPPLERTGHMKDSFGYNATDTHVEVGNNAKYWSFHQSGGKHLPKRLIMGINDTNKRKIGDFIGAALERKFNAA